MTNGADSMIDRVRALSIHAISGYEWECDTCHYHFTGYACHITGVVATDDGYVDSACRPVNHHELLDRNQVLAVLAGGDA